MGPEDDFDPSTHLIWYVDEEDEDSYHGCLDEQIDDLEDDEED